MGGVTIAVQAKAVVQSDAVNRQAVVAGIGTITLHCVDVASRLVDVNARVLLDDVVDVAVDRGRILQGRQIKYSVGANGGIDRYAGTHDDHFFFLIKSIIHDLRLTHRQ